MYNELCTVKKRIKLVMTTLYEKIKLYCAVNGFKDINFLEDIILNDNSDGQGAFIVSWNISLQRPTSKELDECYLKNKSIIPSLFYSEFRKLEYPSIEEQLDMMYHDRMSGTYTWVDTIRSIKERYPKQ